jgi:hypothetical protein
MKQIKDATFYYPLQFPGPQVLAMREEGSDLGYIIQSKTTVRQNMRRMPNYLPMYPFPLTPENFTAPNPSHQAIFGMPFLSDNNLVIDAAARRVIQVLHGFRRIQR